VRKGRSYPALSLCDLIFSGVFERHPRLAPAIVEFELSAGYFPRNQQKTGSCVN
jgi:hypothetical protein